MDFIKRIKKKRIYLDYAATTPVDKKVVKVMERYWSKDFGNAGSICKEGVDAKKALTSARKNIAGFLGARSEEIYFTSGGTESNSLAIEGTLRSREEKGTPRNKMHIITSTIEHPSVLDHFKTLEKEGVEVTYIHVDESGIINPDDVYDSLKPNTVLVSIMYVNNEIGIIQPIPEISKKVKQFDGGTKNELPYFHTDASQAPLYLPINVLSLGVDLMTLDAQKIYGPKGVGCLYRKRGVIISSIFIGGNQEKSLRPGTENVPLIIGFSKALEIAMQLKESEIERLTKLRDYFIKTILEKISNAELNGDKEKRIANNINFSIPGLNSEFLAITLDGKGIASSTKSACLGEKIDGSYVIEALGKSKKHSTSSIRFSLGRDTTKSDIDYVIKSLIQSIEIQSKV